VEGGCPIGDDQEVGHESVDTTIMHIGINLDDLDEAMQMMSQYQKALVCPGKGIFEP